jgi:hypothetical protein
MVAKITFSSPDIWRENLEIHVRNSSRTTKDFAQRVYIMTKTFCSMTVLLFVSLTEFMLAVEQERT